MRILYVSTWYPFPPDNGSRLRAYYLLQALAAAHDVSLVAFRPPGTARASGKAPFALSSLTPVDSDPYRFTRLPQIVKYASPVPLSYWPCRSMARAVHRIATGQTWDAVIAFQGAAAGYALRYRDLPRILDIDTSLSYVGRQHYDNTKGTSARLRSWLSFAKASLYESWLFRRFDLGAVAAQSEVAWLRNLTRDRMRVAVISNGVDCKHNRPGLFAVQRGNLVYNGSLTFGANYDAIQWFLAEIYPLIRRTTQGATLTITGSTEGVDLASLALDYTVNLTGYVDDVRRPVTSAEVCVVPIRQGWGTRLKILEAMALGTPVVATSKAAEGLAVTHGEDIVLADDPSDFATQTVRLLGDESERRRLAANARRLVEAHYDWAQIGAEFVSLVEETVSGRRCTGEQDA